MLSVSPISRTEIYKNLFIKLVQVITILLIGWFKFPAQANAAGIGDPAPSCTASDIQYSITNVLPSGFCFYSGANITVDFDINLWGSQTGHNTAIGYTAAGDTTLRDIECLDSSIDLDSTGCDDYDGSGTASNPVVTKATVNLSCGLPTSNSLIPLDFYLNYETSSGGTNAEITAPTCLVQNGTSIPVRAASLRITASVINDDGGSANPGNWTIMANIAGGPVEFTGNGYFTGDGHIIAGDYVLITTGPSGYTLDAVNCTGATYNAATSAITTLPNNSGNCVMVFNDVNATTLPDPLLTLNKNIINDNGGTATVDDFDLSINSVEVVAGIATTVAADTTFLISELDLPSYTEGTWNCFDNAGITTGLPTNGLATGTKLSLAAGSDVRCSIENDDIEQSNDVDLAINKSVSDSSPSIGDVVVFTLVVSNVGPNDAVDVSVIDVLPNGLIYVVGSITGGSQTSDTSPNGTGLQWTINQLTVGANTSLQYEASVLSP